ncbi:hypothetical protein [Flavobacterium sp. FlaQc-48]|uniref:hypothetical protein n=1 Tax=Flavobacterium sp. FlaQc-48 TaxID=3374181 RepID=UPI003756425C
MVNGFKINKYWGLTFCMLLCSVHSIFSQEVSDAEMGLNVKQLTEQLKKRGLPDEAIDWEIIFARKQYKERYLEMKKIRESLVQKTEAEQKTDSFLISDQEIGFDAARETLLLKERGITNSADLNREIERMREMYNAQYLDMKKSQEEILQKIQPRQLLKATASVTDISQSEKEALKALYDSANGPKWKYNTGWDFSTPVASWNSTTQTGWYGVTVTNGQVTSLALHKNYLNGFIPSEIGQLKYLKILNLSFNELSGNIPEETGQLINVEMLSLNSNKLNGAIPQNIYNLKALTKLTIDNNSLSGIISQEINKLTNLGYIYAAQNQLSGEIPSKIGELQKLVYIDLTNNQLTGSIPHEIGQLRNLTTLYLSYNKLTGTVPSDIGLLKKAKIIALDNNQLSSSIPVEIRNLSLNELYLQNNLFEGVLPNLQIANVLDIRFNKFRFIDLLSYEKKTSASFLIAPQAKTDTAETITSGIGEKATLTMCEDGRFAAADTYQWFKNGTAISGAINRLYTITNLKAADGGVYSCKAYQSSNPDLSSLVLEREPITFNPVTCASIAGEIKSPSEKFYTSIESTFIFEAVAANLTYTWSVATVAGEVLNSPGANTKGLYACKFAAEGDYIVSLIVTDATGCSTTFTKNIKAIDKHCAKEAIRFTFETAGTTTNLKYIWTSTNAANVVVNTLTNKTGQYVFTPELAGEYVIKLTTDGGQNCETLFDKKINVENCIPYASCTKTNNLTPEIHRIFITLINKLASTPSGADVNVYAKKEIAALSPYTNDSKAKIYNFINTSTELGFSFSEASVGKDVQLPKSPSGSIVAIDLSNYDNAVTKITVATRFSDGSGNSNGYVRNIDFCPKELSCVSHAALVIDESGSVSATEANKIKKQLKAFVLQQALTNDAIGSNIYVSLTGMSDSDENTRTDFIKPTKVTNTPASLNQFNKWIDDLGKRKGTGISASSDYWRSGLEGSLSYTMKPNIVIMVTDGCQTADVAGLKQTMKRFNNAPGSDPNLPHLYVVGIEKGFYVDENFYTNKVSDPNNPDILTNTVTTYLAKSLKYLLDFPETQFPKSDINQFDLATYYGHDDFNLLASDETYFSDKLIDANLVCGTPSIKDFCDDCLSFKPEPGQEYVLSAWVKEELLTQVKTYENPVVKIVFYNNKEALDIPAQKIDSLSVKASGNIIDGWQRVVKKFRIPANTITIGILLENNSQSIPVYFDDIRIHPLQGSVKSFVYDPETFRLMSELDENNYSTFYEYDHEGGLVRVKKETEKGIKTIQETRSGSFINTN